MKTIRFLPVLMTVFMAVSCAPIMMKLNHVTKPKVVTEEKISSFLAKVNSDYVEHLFLCRDSIAYTTLLQKLHAFPEAVFFNEKGEIVRYSEDPCPTIAQNFILNIKPDQQLQVDSSYRFGFLQEKLQPHGNSQLRDPGNYRFTMVVFWATWAGKVNNNVFDIVEKLKKRPDLKVQVVFINMDFLDQWGMKKLPRFKNE